MSELLGLDRSRAATWHALTTALADALRTDDLGRASALVAATRDDLWLGVTDSDFVVLAAAAAARRGATAEALSLVHDAKRFGHPRFFLFDPGWGSIGIVRSGAGWALNGAPLEPEGPYALHRLLEPLYDDAAVAAFVRARFSARVDLEGAKRPLAWFEETAVGKKSARCAVSGRPLAKGARAVGYRVWNGPFDVASDLVLADPDAWNASAEARARSDKFARDAYTLDDFTPPGPFEHPEVNAFFHDRASLDAGLRVIVEARAHPTPWALGDWQNPPREARPTATFAGGSGELVDLLWVLVKCGHLAAIEARLGELPECFPLLLMLFERPPLRAAMAERLGAPELVAIFQLLGQPKLSGADRARLVRFGIEHPRLRALFGALLARYEVHLYSNYQCSPNWFFQDFRAFVRGRGRNYVYLLAGEPELLEPLGAVRRHRAPVRRPDLSVGGVAYDDIAPTFLEVAMVADLLTEDPRPWPEEDSDAPSRPLDAPRRAAEAVAKHLGKARPKRPERAAAIAIDPAETNPFVLRTRAFLAALERSEQIEIEGAKRTALIDDLADALAAGVDARGLEALLTEHDGVVEIYATATELAAALAAAVD